MQRTTNKLADILANQGVICIENRVVMGWQELPQNRLKVNCYDQADEDRMVFRNRAMEAGSRGFNFFMISGFFIVWSLVSCRPLSTFATLVSTFTKAPGGSSSRDSIFWMVAMMERVTSYIGSGRGDVARGQNLGSLDSLKTPGFPSLDTILCLGWFIGDRKPCKKEVVFPKWE